MTETHYNPVIVSMSPAFRAVDINITGTTISAVFNNPMDPVAFTSSTFGLLDGERVVVLGTISVDGNIAIFTPEEDLNYNTIYTAFATTGVYDLEGYHMARAENWTFTTELAPYGVYPSRRLSRAWVTQRLVNRAPEETNLRKHHTSYGQQVLNPVGLEIQETIQKLTESRYNQFLSSADLKQLDVLYKAELSQGMLFSYTENSVGERTYVPPTVHATIDSIEHEISIAENNDLETLGVDAVPSRTSYSDISEEYFTIIPETEVSDLSSVTPQDFAIDSYLYITLKENTTWEVRAPNKIYYPKCFITGKTRKGTTVTEAVPLRYNGTFRTLNEWHSVESVFVNYLDNTAKITIEIFPLNRDNILDTRNICVPSDGFERPSYIKLNNENAWGSLLVFESFTTHDMDVVRSGLDEKETFMEMELLDSDGETITAIDFVPKPFGRFAYVLDADKLHVYDISWPCPDYTKFIGESPEARIDLLSDSWVNARDEETTIRTHNLAIEDVPYKYRWLITIPDGTEYYINSGGTLVPTTEDTWIENPLWSEVSWHETELELLLDQTGEWVIGLECVYYNEQIDDITTLITKFMSYVPAIEPEISFDLPEEVKKADNLWIDSDSNLWIIKDGIAYKMDVFYDYYIVDYMNNVIWLRENYSSVRITV